MKAIRLTADQAYLFFELCQELKADTEEKRLAIINTMAEFEEVESITQTSMTKDEYIKHISQKFGKVLVIKPEEKDNG